MKKCIFFPVVAGTTLLLSGCATLELFSFGVSGLSYAVTGKSLSDHALSTVMEQDCALHRAITEDTVCTDPDGNGVLRKSKPDRHIIARANEAYWQDLPVNRRSQSASDVTGKQVTSAQGKNTRHSLNRATTKISPDETVKQLIANNQKPKPSAALKTVSYQTGPSKVEIGTIAPIEMAPIERDFMPLPRMEEKPQLYAVLGSYNELHFAKQSLHKFPGLNPQVINNPARATDKNATLYRVVAGPFSKSDFNTKLNPAYNAWRIELCPQNMMSPPCNGQMLANNK